MGLTACPECKFEDRAESGHSSLGEKMVPVHAVDASKAQIQHTFYSWTMLLSGTEDTCIEIVIAILDEGKGDARKLADRFDAKQEGNRHCHTRMQEGHGKIPALLWQMSIFSDCSWVCLCYLRGVVCS